MTLAILKLVSSAIKTCMPKAPHNSHQKHPFPQTEHPVGTVMEASRTGWSGLRGEC